MSDVLEHPQAYVKGQLTIEKNGEGRFIMYGNWSELNRGTDHQQLIYEALEIAANSTDRYAPQFRAMCDEYLELTKDWVD